MKRPILRSITDETEMLPIKDDIRFPDGEAIGDGGGGCIYPEW